MAVILTTTAYAPLALLQAWLQEVARSQPGDRGGRSGAAGLRRQRHLGRDLAGAAGAGRAAGSCSARCALREMRRTGSRERDGAVESRRARPAPELAARASATGARFAYTRPSPGRYPWQWYWDSCFAAIVWRRFDPGAGAGRAGEPARRPAPGRLHRPHDLLGPPGLADPAALLQRRLARRRSRPRRSSRRCWPGPGGSPSATRRGAADRRPGRLAEPPTATSRATACSGSSSPTSRASTPRRSSTRSGAGGPTAGSAFPLLVRRNRRLGFDARRVRERGGPVLCEVAGQHALVALAAGAGPPLGDAGAGRAALGRAPRRSSSTRRSRAACARGPSPGPRWRRWRCPTCRRRSAGGWSRSTCSTEREFLTPVAPPSVAVSEPSYEPGGGRGPIRRYWRGPTWVNSAWMVWLGLRRLGYEAGGGAAGRRRDRRGRARRPARVLRPARRHAAWARRTSPGRR